MRGSAIVSAVIVAIIAIEFPASAHAATDHLVIAEVQVGGASARDEFVELYNPTSSAISLEGWRLSKRTGTGNREENLVTTFGAIDVPPHRSVLVAPNDSVFGTQVDVAYSTQSSLGFDNTVVLYGPANGSERPIIDLIGFGEVMYREGAATANPQNNQSIERKLSGVDGNEQDTNDNAADFIIQTQPTPQNRSADARPALTPADRTSSSSGDAATGSSDGSGSDASSSGAGSDTTSGSSANADTSNQNQDASASANTGTDTATSNESNGDAAANSAANAQSNSAQTQSSGGGSAAPPPVPTHVRINEFVADPAAGDEWIEFVNIGAVPVNLADWIIEDGNETKTVLTGAIGIGDQRFFVLTKPKGQLNNSGDRITLATPSGTVVDAVSYGNWDDGKTSDNAPAAADPAAVARVVDGVDTNNDRLDFVRTETPTPGRSNIVAAAPSEDEQAKSGSNDRAATAGATRPIIVLNELLPNPVGEDREEFIEIANIGNANAEVNGWRLRDELGAEYIIVAADGPTAIAAGATLVFPRARTGIALNNTGGEVVRLFAPESERAASVAEYHGAVEEGWSWARGEDGRWSWSLTPTPNAVNAIAKPNRAPDAVIEGSRVVNVGAVIAFDGSDSADPDREAVTLLWNFGDDRTEADVAATVVGRYVYDRPGTYTVALAVTDARGLTATAKHRVVVRAPIASANDAQISVDDARDAVRLSELLPNPDGSDDAEWIEVENVSERAVEIGGWSVVVRGDGATERRVEIGLVRIPAHGYALVRRSVSGIALRNTSAVVELRDARGIVVDSVAYDGVREGQSYARMENGWEWTSMVTPEATNVAIRGDIEDVPVARSGGTIAGAVAVRAGARPSAEKIGALRSTSLGERIVVHGTVTAPPGSVGKQVFYIADENSGVQVYVGAREVPRMAIGDRVEVRGELREVSGELRVGIGASDDIRVLGRGSEVSPMPLRAQEANNAMLGTIVVLEGDVVDVRGRTITVDDGSDEIRLALPATADENNEGVAMGDTIRATGILSKTRTGYRILARAATDIEHLRKAAAPAIAARREPTPPARDQTEALALGGGGVLAATSLWRRRRTLLLAANGIRRILRWSRSA